MKHRSIPRAGRLTCAALALCVLSTGPARGADSTRAAYLSNRGGVARTFDVILHDFRSDGEVNLTAGTGIAGVASISSPRLLATRNSVVCIASGGKDLVEVSCAGGAPRFLARGLAITGSLAIAPDEKAVAFACTIDGRSQICEVDLTGGVSRNLSANAWNDSEMAYAPDGRSLAFVTDRDGSRSVAIMQRDGLGQRVLTNDLGDDRFPCFAPAGDRIVFASSRSALGEGAFDLYSIETGGRAFSLLFQNGSYNAHPVFSPDGTHLAFLSTNLTKKLGHIVLMDVPSGRVRTITDSLAYLKGPPAFNANGRYLVFDHNTIRDCEIMLVDMLSGDLRNISNTGSWDCGPSF
ncbi:MAG: PD40 domain-containing protein [Ignavibacteriae bacterium]|nr:PD40 domain-containing protein [Ignavibacteriota bacterium]